VSGCIYKFGDFELDPSHFELRKNSRVQKLERIPMELLILLAEKEGSVATRQEIIERLWGTDVFVDTEHGINTAIRKIRQALRDEPEEPRFILTVTGKGYRFVPQVVRMSRGNGAAVVGSTALPAVHSPAEPAIKPSEKTGVATPHPVAARRHMSLFLLGSVAMITFAVWVSFSSPHPPRITGATQITSDGRWKFGAIATDGLRLYFTEDVNGNSTVASVPASGGEPVPLQMSLREATLLNISPDRLDLLVAEGEVMQESALWRVPALGGTPRRLGNVLAHDASWSPDGKKLAYVNGCDIYLASADGTDPRKVLSGQDSSVWAWRPLWSPDGKRLRWDYYQMGNQGAKIWEMNADGGNPHPLLPASEDWSMQAFGDWTPDGKYYIFTSWKDLESGMPWPASNLWAIREGVRFFRKSPASPMNLTTGPMHYFSHTTSTDGKTIFAVSSQKYGELVRYDVKAGAFVPYSSGLSAEGVAFSRDKRWRAYVKYPQGELWRSREDGSESLQLTSRPLFAFQPEWSPDGKQIAFSGQRAGEKWQVYTVSAQGGSPQAVPEAVDAMGVTWSPDGCSIIFGNNGIFGNSGGIRTVDLRTRIVTTIADSDGLSSPRLSPDGLSIVANDAHRLMLFNFKTKVWAEYARMEQLGWLNWSAGGNYVYFVGSTSDDAAIFRMAVRGGKSDKIVSVKNFRFAGAGGGSFSLGPADELLLLRDIGGGTEIYALSWDAQ
jgi:Tol biopolymer transport system component/DNA-binding winged helix-turn-helix (wHTH) protein